MSMTTSGSHSGLSSDINVTPMIDILLVLLIIFMAITPVSPRGLDALVPQPSKSAAPNNPQSIVVQVIHRLGGEPGYKINQTEIARGDLQNALTGIFATRSDKVMFIKGDETLDFAPIADAINVGKAAGVDHIGLITPKMESGQ